jgi:hypothetical protein
MSKFLVLTDFWGSEKERARKSLVVRVQPYIEEFTVEAPITVTKGFWFWKKEVTEQGYDFREKVGSEVMMKDGVSTFVAETVEQIKEMLESEDMAAE